MAFETILPIKPVPKQRPRRVRVGNRMVTYTPKETKQFEKHLRVTVTAELRMAGHQVPLYPTGAVVLEVEAGPTRADADNVYKSVADAMNGVLYKDDRQVEIARVKLDRTARYPRLRIFVDRVKSWKTEDVI